MQPDQIMVTSLTCTAYSAPSSVWSAPTPNERVPNAPMFVTCSEDVPTVWFWAQGKETMFSFLSGLELSAQLDPSRMSLKKSQFLWTWALGPSEKMRLDEGFRYLCLTPRNTLLVTIFEGHSVLDFAWTLLS